jgi:hypothetical protein
MGRRDATTPRDADLLTEELLTAVPTEREPEPEPEPEPERKATPHEKKRKARQMSLTFPSPEWKQAIKEQADKWNMRPSDLLVYCVSYTMQAIEDGEVRRPDGRVGRFYHRAGEALDLPWEPQR